jgi:YggT family protein
VAPLATVSDPYLNLFRGLIPPIGMMDLSPILAFITLDVFTSTAAALPAVKGQGQAASASQQQQQGPMVFASPLRFAHEAFRRRADNERARKEAAAAAKAQQ